MDRSNSKAPHLGGAYAGGTIAIRPELFSSPQFIAKKDATHTYFCILMLVILLIVAILFPRDLGASGMSYKVREIFLILASMSFAWSALKRLRVWRFGIIGKLLIFLFFGVGLSGLTTGLLLIHGIEERASLEHVTPPTAGYYE